MGVGNFESFSALRRISQSATASLLNPRTPLPGVQGGGTAAVHPQDLPLVTQREKVETFSVSKEHTLSFLLRQAVCGLSPFSENSEPIPSVARSIIRSYLDLCRGVQGLLEIKETRRPGTLRQVYT